MGVKAVHNGMLKDTNLRATLIAALLAWARFRPGSLEVLRTWHASLERAALHLNGPGEGTLVTQGTCIAVVL